MIPETRVQIPYGKPVHVSEKGVNLENIKIKYKKYLEKIGLCVGHSQSRQE